MGTKPRTFGIPSSDTFPFVIDCVTSVNQCGKIKKYSREGVATPRDDVIDDQGIERTGTDGILRDMVRGKCALTPLGGARDAMGGYKGKHSFMFGYYQSVDGFSSQVKHVCTRRTHMVWPSTLILRTA